MSPLAVSAWRWRSALRITFIYCPMQRKRHWLYVGYRRMDTLVSTSLHVSSKIHVFFLAYLDFGLGISWRMLVKSFPSLIGVNGGRKGRRVYHPSYFECFLRVALQRHPRIR